MEAPECRGYSTLVLDVLDFNESAFLWYQRLGFRVFQRRDWYVGGARKALVNKAGLVMGFPQAEAVQARFGFSLFRVVTSRGDYAVGRLGTKWFRVPQADAFSDDELMFSLNRLDSNRQILLIIPQGAQGSALKVAERRLTTNSMRVSMEELFSRLGSPKGQITELE